MAPGRAACVASITEPMMADDADCWAAATAHAASTNARLRLMSLCNMAPPPDKTAMHACAVRCGVMSWLAEDRQEHSATLSAYRSTKCTRSGRRPLLAFECKAKGDPCDWAAVRARTPTFRPTKRAAADHVDG